MDTSSEGQFKCSKVINTGSNARINELVQGNSVMAGEKFSPRNIYRYLFIHQIYQDAYSKIKSKSGNMTPGIDSETLDGFSNMKINKIVLDMKNRSFKFKPSRQLLIPKPNGGFRTLGVPSPVDKIVQSAIKSLIEKVYEPIFKESSHGFRPNRGCHTA
jgi:retron-type reverse transcriptase